jgi:two-component sensor histidine kinase
LSGGQSMSATEQGRKEIAHLPLLVGGISDLPALVAVIRRLSIAHSVEEIIDIVTRAARHLLRADGITFVLREGDLCYYAEEDAISPLWKGRRFPMSACISGWCMSEGRAAIIRDIYQDDRIPHDAYRPTFVRSLAMVPVRQDNPIAAMGAYWSDVTDTAQQDLDLLQTIANCAALALAKVELEQEREKARTAQLESSHRLKNLLSIIDSISRQTFRSAKSPKEFAETFSARLQAFARAQSLLDQSGSTGAELRGLIGEQLAIGAQEDQIICSGPDVFLSADEAFDIGLVLHELGTNARKYGALSSGTGRIRIEWHIAQQTCGRVLELSWSEEGGPPVSVPARTGFGSALLQHAFTNKGGEARTRYEPSGIVCTMRLPLT